MKFKNLLICILVMSFILCPITVFAESFEEELIITDMTDEELEDLMGIQTYASTTETLNIAKWQKIIDTSKNDINGYSVSYYAPVYNGILYNNYMIIKGQTSSSSASNKYRLIYYTDDITWVNKPIKFSDGILIMIESTATDIDTLNEYLYNPNAERTAVSATVRTSTEGTQMYWSDRAQTTYTTNENHHDTYYIWYQNMYNNEPPILTENGACAQHQYNMISSAASCTRPGGITYVCKNCYYSYFEETTEKLNHDFNDENICNTCGTEYSPDIDNPSDSGGSGGSGGSGTDTGFFSGLFSDLFDFFTDKFSSLTTALDTIKDLLMIPDAGFIAEIDNILMENLEDNKFFTSVRYIERTLTSLYSEDYSSKTGFKELGLTNLHLRQPTQTIYADFGNEIIGGWNQEYTTYTSKIDWGLESVDVMPMGWFFGQQVGTTGDGTPLYTKGVKAYSDAIISAFLWVAFAFMLWQRLPDIVSGDFASTNCAANPC